MLKFKLYKAPILIFLDWTKKFNIHVDASIQTIGAVLAKCKEDKINHLINFPRCKIADAKKNYTIIK